MTVKQMLENLIEEEISRIEQNGEKVKLKTLRKKRIIYSLVFGLIFIILMGCNNYILSLGCLVLYFFYLYKTNNVSIIAKLAEQSPDTPVSDIIRGEMK